MKEIALGARLGLALFAGSVSGSGNPRPGPCTLRPAKLASATPAHWLTVGRDVGRTVAVLPYNPLGLSRHPRYGRSTQSGITLDAGALIALDNGDRKMIALLSEALVQRRAFRVPSGVVGQTWRDGRRQANLARFLRAIEVEVLPLDYALARACGELCGFAGTNDVIDASVVIIARDRQDVIVTSDPDDIRRLDQDANLVRI